MKVLIISYNPLTLSNNGGKHLCALFSEFKQNEMMQYYVYPTLPDSWRCDSYFQQTDLQLLSGLKQKKTSHIVEPLDDKKTTLHRVPSIYSRAGKYRYAKLLCRDILWKVSKWDTKELDAWIKDGKPDCIFSDTGDSCFLYNISLKLSKKYHLPIISSFGDDYYSIPINWRNPLKAIQLTLLKKKIRQFIKKCDYTITINQCLSDYYSTVFFPHESNRIKAIYMGATVHFDDLEIESRAIDSKAMVFSYIGNISFGRWDNLLSIGKAIDSYNVEFNTSHVLRIYAKLSEENLSQCREICSIQICGFIPGTEVKGAILDSDVLIHTESFYKENIEKTMFSLSTKIADSLGSGRYFFAYGPSEVASMRHLIDNKCAYCVTEQDNLFDAIKLFLSDRNIRDESRKNAKEVFLKYHNTRNSSNYLRMLFTGMVTNHRS